MAARPKELGRIIWSVLLLLTSFGVGAASGQGVASSFTASNLVAISGVVEDAVTGVTIAGAEVRVSGRAVDRAKQLSDSRGRFIFVGLPSNTDLEVFASKHGYLDSSLGSGYQEFARRTVFRIDAGQAAAAKVRLWAPSAIEGRVVDERSRPIVGATARSIRAVEVLGTTRLVAGPTGKTDDRGLFRISGLVPGNYAVLVSAQDVDAPSKDGQPQVYLDGIYPSSVMSSHTGMIDVRPGVSATGFEFRLAVRPAFSVIGEVVGSSLPAGLKAVLLAADGPDDWAFSKATSTVDERGTFSFSNIPEGRYRLNVAAVHEVWSASPVGVDSSRPATGTPRGSPSVGLSLPGAVTVSVPSRDAGLAVSGDTVFEVEHRNVVGLKVEIRQTPTLAGVLIDERPQDSWTRQLPVAIGAAPSGGLAIVDPKTGRFEIAGIQGESVFLFTPFFAIKSALVAGTDYADRPIDMRTNPTNVIVHISDLGAQIEGRVVDGNGQPVGGARVLFFPVERERWPTTRRFGTVVTDTNGRYRLNRVVGLGLLPGDEYCLVALQDDEIERFGRRLMDSLRPFAQVVTAKWGATVFQDLRLASQPR